MTRWEKHKALIGYLFIVVVAVAAVEFHHWRTTSEINHTARDACAALEAVTENQRFVLETLRSIIAAETASGDNPALVIRLAGVEFRIDNLPVYNCHGGRIEITNPL